MNRYIWLALTLWVAGCATPTPAERAAEMQREIDEMIQIYGPACEKLGYKNGTDKWRDCILRMSAKEAQQRYRSMPTTTSCFGHRGFYQCTTF